MGRDKITFRIGPRGERRESALRTLTLRVTLTLTRVGTERSLPLNVYVFVLRISMREVTSVLYSYPSIRSELTRS